MAKKTTKKKTASNSKKDTKVTPKKVVKKEVKVAKPAKKTVVEKIEPKKSNVTIIKPKKTQQSSAPMATGPKKPVTEIAFSSMKEQRREEVKDATVVHENLNTPNEFVPPPVVGIVPPPTMPKSNVTYVSPQGRAKVENTEAKNVLTELAQKVYYICNQGHLPRAFQVVDKIRELNPAVHVHASHPSPDSTRQTKFVLTYLGESITCPNDGYYSTNP